jgi:ferrous iron transport protein A
MSKTLVDLSCNQSARIASVHIVGEAADRLASLGLRVGRHITLLRQGILGGPLHLRIGSTEFILRPQLAQSIEVL